MLLLAVFHAENCSREAKLDLEIFAGAVVLCTSVSCGACFSRIFDPQKELPVHFLTFMHIKTMLLFSSAN